MNDNNKHENQASDLAKIFAEVQANEPIKDHEQVVDTFNESDEIRQIDILNLPPRKEVHGKINQRTRLKVGRPFRRLLSVIICLIFLALGAYYIWRDELTTTIFNL